MERTLRTNIFHNKTTLSIPPKSPEKEPCQRSQTSLEGDSPTTPTPSPTTPLPLPRKDTAPDTPAEERPGSDMVVPVALPRRNPPSKHSEPLEDTAADPSKTSTKTSSSDSGIEDGKSTPTSVEEKVHFLSFASKKLTSCSINIKLCLLV